ncbi:hypothetical protein E2C01_018649 [Portunus trituberculatus]|uniref:Uncharacterized protein n=1 Tax=Portunus trituberculatus TaxID=210409 RepID=A0A5B7DV32_PORTR|nr:hypothetical protein [Portunus trituberculatus]
MLDPALCLMTCVSTLTLVEREGRYRKTGLTVDLLPGSVIITVLVRDVRPPPVLFPTTHGPRSSM